MKKSREFVLYNCFKEVHGYMQNEKVSSDTKNNKQENIIFGNAESVMGMHSEKISEFLTHSFILYHKIMQCWMQLEMINPLFTNPCKNGLSMLFTNFNKFKIAR